jgi:uncharacterized protein YodC (DUF2158 family)
MNYSIGCTVQLTSGGPIMSVTAVDNVGMTLSVVWTVYGDSSYSVATLPQACFKAATP